MNAKNAESLNEHMQGRVTPVVRGHVGVMDLLQDCSSKSEFLLLDFCSSKSVSGFTNGGGQGILIGAGGLAQ
jgi:hypothetical protein